MKAVTWPVVLVAHAYARAVIAATRDEKKVKALVYVAALAPHEGETVADVFYCAQRHPQASKVSPDNHGLIYLPEEAFAATFAQHASVAERAVPAAFQGQLSLRASRSRWVDRYGTQRFMAQRMAVRVRLRPLDHTPMVAAPPVVAEIIREAIRVAVAS